MHWADGSVSCALYDGDKLLGYAMRFNCCSWVIYDRSAFPVERAGFGQLLPGQYPGQKEAQQALEEHFKKINNE